MYDVIGDVHGQGEKLRALLRRLGYTQRGGSWQAPQGRQAIFVGDLIDRGPEQREVLGIVRSMIDAGQARAVMGNHEFNAIAFATRHPGTGEPLRPRSDKNRRQHASFLQAVDEGSALHREWVEWFRTLPLALDLGGIRVVHAWWDDAAVASIDAAARRGMDDELLVACFDDPVLTQARKLLTCGVEMDLPPGCWIVDKEGHQHADARLAVWRHRSERLRDIAIVPAGSEHAVPDIRVPDEYRLPPLDGAPVLFGHHWFTGPVRLEGPKVACLDWSAAKAGPLVAYRWDGEDKLRDDRLVAVGADMPKSSPVSERLANAETD
jgi:hypothetical protein